MNSSSDTRKKLAPPNGWQSYRLGDLAKYWNGRAFKPEEWQKKGRPIIRIENLTSPTAPYNCFEGDVRPENEVVDGDLLVSWSASLDAFWWNRGSAILNQHIFKVEENKHVILRRFLYYILRHAMSKIRARVHGATMQHITKPEFKRIEVAVPSLYEQERIVTILDEQLATIEQAKLAEESRLESATALFGAFVRRAFDTDKVKTWPRKELLALCTKSGQYGTSQKSNNKGHGLPILGMYHIHKGRIRWGNVSHVNLDKTDAEKYLLRRGDLLFNRTNSAELVGKTAVYDLHKDAVFASYLVRFCLNEKEADPYFVSTYINSRYGRAFIERNMARAIGQVNISASTMHKMPLPTPELETQQRIARSIIEKQVEIDEIHASLQSEAEAIAALPAAMLRRAFAGEL